MTQASSIGGNSKLMKNTQMLFYQFGAGGKATASKM